MRAPEKTLAVVDHNVPTTDRSHGIENPESALQVETLAKNAAEFGIEYFNELDHRQGIVHIIGPEQGFTLPGMTIVCGDSHTSTHGAFGALAHGIGTSEVEHVLATQTLIQKKAKNMRVTVDGKLPPGVTAKDIILAIIGEIGTAGGTGHVIEYAGEAIRAALDGRPHDGLQHVDRGRRPRRPDRAGRDDLRLHRRPAEGAEGRGVGHGARATGRRCRPEEGAEFDREVRLDAARRCRRSSPGAPARRTSSPSTAACRTRPRSPIPTGAARSSGRWPTWAWSRTRAIKDIAIDHVFLGSCTNGRIEDLRAAAKIVAGKQVHEGVSAMVVPGSGLVKEQAEAEGLDEIFKAAGFEWREPGLLDVPRHERGPAEARRALRLDLEPQLRGPAGLQGPHPPGVAGDGGGGGDRRPLRRRARMAAVGLCRT